jgi:hypothetical protein
MVLVMRLRVWRWLWVALVDYFYGKGVSIAKKPIGL